MGVTFVTASGAFGASEPLKLKIIYSSFTGAYTPLWLAVASRPARWLWRKASCSALNLIIFFK